MTTFRLSRRVGLHFHANTPASSILYRQAFVTILDRCWSIVLIDPPELTRIPPIFLIGWCKVSRFIVGWSCACGNTRLGSISWNENSNAPVRSSPSLPFDIRRHARLYRGTVETTRVSTPCCCSLYTLWSRHFSGSLFILGRVLDNIHWKTIVRNCVVV